MIKVSPSILAADFADLKTEIQKVEGVAAMLHLDVMDGHFVPNISIGMPVVAAIRKQTSLVLDTHLMITRPQDYIEEFAAAGADLICFHLEAEGDPLDSIRLIRSCGKKAAIALKPATPAARLFPYIKELDMVLVMTVEPGFGGQVFQLEMLEKIAAIRSYANEVNPDLAIEVDGGINRETAQLAVNAGANVLVSGSAIFCSENPREEIEFLAALRPEKLL